VPFLGIFEEKMIQIGLALKKMVENIFFIKIIDSFVQTMVLID